MIAAALFALLLAAPPTSKEDPEVKAGVADYVKGDYEKARARLQRAIERPTLPTEERARAHIHLGFCEVAFGNKRAAKLEFKQALLVDPTLSLDPALISPKIIAIFDDAKREMPAGGGGPKPPSQMTAAARSAIVPGWGQLGTGRKMSAATFVTAQATAIGFLVWNQQQVGVAKNNLSRAQPLEKSKMRSELREFEMYRNLSAAAIVTIGAAAATDAWFGARPKSRVITVAPTEDGAMVAFSARF